MCPFYVSLDRAPDDNLALYPEDLRALSRAAVAAGWPDRDAAHLLHCQEDGEGLSAEQAARLADALDRALASGTVDDRTPELIEFLRRGAFALEKERLDDPIW